MKFVATRVGYQLVIDTNGDGTPEKVLTSAPILVADSDAVIYQGIAAAAGVALLVAQAPDTPAVPPDPSLAVATRAEVNALIASGVPPAVSAALAANGTVADAATAAATSAVGGALADAGVVKGGQSYPLSDDLAISIVDLMGRRSWLEALNNGQPSPNAVALLKAALGGALFQTTPDTSGVAIAITDSIGHRSWLEAGYDGKPTDNARRLGAPTYYADPAGNAAPFVSVSEVAAVGDSTTEGLDVVDPANRWTTLLAGDIHWPVYNRGSSGATSEQIAARYGAVPVIATVPGGSIPASGGIDLAPLSIDAVAGGGAATLPATLRTNTGVTVPGTLARNGTTRIFTRNVPGSVIPATGTVEVWLKADPADPGRVLMFGAGINDEPLVAAGTWTVEDLKRIYAAVTSSQTGLVRRRVIWGMLDRGPAEAVGTTTGNLIRDLERWLGQTYGVDFLPVRQYLASSQALTDAALVSPGFVATTADNDAVTARTVPPSFRVAAGSVHLNELGHKLQARLFGRHFRSPLKGWV